MSEQDLREVIEEVRARNRELRKWWTKERHRSLRLLGQRDQLLSAMGTSATDFFGSGVDDE